MAYTTLANIKEYGNITSTNAGRDTFISNLITRAESIINKYCDVQSFDASSQTAIFTEKWYLNDWLYIRTHAIDTVASIKLYEMDADRTLEDTLTSTEYYIDKSEARIKNLFGNTNLEIEVVYTPQATPSDIQQATIELVYRMLNESNYGRGAFDMTSKEIADESLQVYNTGSLPRNVKLILDRYRGFAV